MRERRRLSGRIIGAGLLSILIGGLVVSCQSEKRPDGPAAPSAEATPTTMPSGEAQTASTSTSAKADLSHFSYPAAPAQKRDPAEVTQMNASCVACHTSYAPHADGSAVVNHTMHATDVGISCVDCHGGNWKTEIAAGFTDNRETYNKLKDEAHPKARLAWLWKKGREQGGNPELAAHVSTRETADYIRFINPGDLRAAYAACGACHNTAEDGYIIDRVQKSMMTHGAMLWGAALYNNGSYNRKNPIYGESYIDAEAPTRTGHYAHERSVQDPEDTEARAIAAEEAAHPGPHIEAIPAVVIADEKHRPTVRQMRERGVLPQLFPLPRWEISQPGNVLRVFERGGRLRPVIGIPFPPGPAGGQGMLDDPGKPEVKLSIRDYGTDVRTDPVMIGLQKTRLLDPTLNFMGTNDHPGDFRASGCSACHVVYANDRSPVHSAQWSKFGNRGESFSADPTVNPSGVTTTQPSNGAPVREPGHPIEHVFVKNMPTSTCISCHVHPGTNVLNSYLGFMWWDNESDGKFMYPKNQQYATADDFYEVSKHNPEGSAVRGLWSNHHPDEKNHVGLTAGPDFLENLSTLDERLKNELPTDLPAQDRQLQRNVFGDFHGHGWVFRAVFKQDRRGHLLDHAGNPVKDLSHDRLKEAVNFSRAEQNDKPKDGVPVHLKDIHLEMGMQCVDCHFNSDNHGDGNLYGETRNATVINCEDCHGTMTERAKIFQYFKLTTSERNGDKGTALLKQVFTGNAMPSNPDEGYLARVRKFIDARFRFSRNVLVQKSALDGSKSWTVVQTLDTMNADWRPDTAGKRSDGQPEPSDAEKKNDEMRAMKARFAHTIRRDGKHWGGTPASDQKGYDMELAHGSDTMSCYACHSSWNTSCFGCHLPQRANQRRDMLHNEGQKTRNYTNYNYQTLRDDVYMLGVDSTVKKHKVVPIRSACAVMVSSQDALRQWIYAQQQTVSAEGFAGTAFSPYFPHTVRSTETKQCTDCHLSKEGDNNAVMAQLMLQGTNSVNFIGKYAWVAASGGGVEAVAVAERDEPQAVIGSTLHKWAYPDFFDQHQKRGMELATSHEHTGTVLDVQLRGEYLYAACGSDGFIAYDVANIDNKGFSERIITAPVSPLGQRFYVKSKYATSITSPSTLAIDPTRPRLPVNEEGKITKLGDPSKVIEESKPIHLMYAFLYLTDRDEGLIVIGNSLNEKRNKPGVATLLDGDPDNNFLERALTFNPDGILKGARSMAFHGHHGYVVCDAGVVVVDFDNPLDPKVVTVLSQFNGARKIQFQFRYGFVLDNEGMHVIDVTFPDKPKMTGVSLPIADARDLYISRSYGFVAAGQEGLVILDLMKPLAPQRVMAYDADGRMNDATAVRVGMTNSSQYAYVADGRNGLKVIQLTSPDDNPTYMGFAPTPQPQLIAWKHTAGPAVSISEGLDRDRAVAEDGQQLSVFGRRGARPFTLEEQQRLYLRTGADGSKSVYMVSDLPNQENVELKVAEAPKPAGGDEGGTPSGPRRPGGRRPGGAATEAPAGGGDAAEQPAAPAPRRPGPRRPGG